jgi:hypothetical protein
MYFEILCATMFRKPTCVDVISEHALSCSSSFLLGCLCDWRAGESFHTKDAALAVPVLYIIIM